MVDDGSTEAHVKQLIKEYVSRDGRIKACFLEENKGISIASNEGAAMATGQYIGFLDHDDELSLNALYEMARSINAHDPDIIYSDEDLINRESRYLDYFFKPDYNAELLLSHNYITHFMITKRSLFESVGGFSKEFDGAQDYDLLLKLTERSKSIHHIDETLYHWRAIEESTSINHAKKEYANAAGEKALKAALKRRKIKATVKPGQFSYYYGVERKLAAHPLVSFIAIIKDVRSNAEDWITRMIRRSTYPNLEFLFLFPDKSNEKVITRIEKIDNRIKSDRFKVAHPLSDVLNQAVKISTGEHLIFIEQNIEPIRQNWIEMLLGYSQESDIGAVGGLVNYNDDPKNKINALPNLKNHTWEYYRDYFQNASRHLNGLFCPQNVLAVSSDLFMIERKLFNAVNGFNEKEMRHVMFDSDFCLRLRDHGVENVYSPACEANCNQRIMPAISRDIAKNEVTLFKKRWNKRLTDGDPYYNVKRILHDKKISRNEWLKWFAGAQSDENEEQR